MRRLLLSWLFPKAAPVKVYARPLSHIERAADFGLTDRIYDTSKLSIDVLQRMEEAQSASVEFELFYSDDVWTDRPYSCDWDFTVGHTFRIKGSKLEVPACSCFGECAACPDCSDEPIRSDKPEENDEQDPYSEFFDEEVIETNEVGWLQIADNFHVKKYEEHVAIIRSTYEDYCEPHCVLMIYHLPKIIEDWVYYSEIDDGIEAAAKLADAEVARREVSE